MRIKVGDDIHTAIQKICETSTRAGSVVVLLLREYEGNTIDYLRVIDSKGLYGSKLADFYFKDCHSNINEFLKRITDG